MDIKAVIFDMDGVIFDTERIYLEDWTKVFKKYGYEMKKEIYLSVMGRGRKVVKEVFRKHFGQELPIEKMYKEKDFLLNEAINNNKIPLKEGAIEILNFLGNNGYKIALASSAKRDRILKQVELAGIKEKFKIIVSGDDVKNNKPDPEIFLKAAKGLDVSPKQCIVIEDSTSGICAASKAGMIALHVEDLKKADNEILLNCYSNFKNLTEILQYLQSKVME